MTDNGNVILDVHGMEILDPIAMENAINAIPGVVDVYKRQAPHRPMYMQEYLYSIRNHRYTATMLQHIAEDRDGTSH